jgi:pilus assembly protein CpaE
LFVERAAIEVNDKVRLIAADEPIDAELQITEAGMRHILSVLRQRFNFIVVDVPVPLSPPIKAVVSVARHVLVMLEPEVTGLRNTNAVRKAMTALPARTACLRCSTVPTDSGLDLATVTHGLDSPPDIVIPISVRR